MTKSIHVFGATGSIGESAKDVLMHHSDLFSVQILTAHSNWEKLAKTALDLNASHVVIGREEFYADLKTALSGSGIEVSAGREALLEAAQESADLSLMAIMGLAGLEPLMRSIPNARAVAIANKEPLVAAGPQVLDLAARHKTQILPIDSEHNAIFQVFDPDNKAAVERMILTASGGPFRTWTKAAAQNATLEQALKHPNWDMGKKITIDSATMMNKALEVIEAHYLFDMPPSQIEVLIHPQSIVHSMVEYKDGSTLAQMGASDMRTPLTHILGWPDRIETPGQRLDFTSLGSLEFIRPDFDRFEALALAYECLNAGQSHCIGLNAANEVAVQACLEKEIPFGNIMMCLHKVFDKLEGKAIKTLDDITGYDNTIRNLTMDILKTL